jgi:hypothetical protein
MKTRRFAERHPTKSANFLILFVLVVAYAGLLTSHATSANGGSEPKDLPIVQVWSGDYPVLKLSRLPKGQRSSRIGCLEDAATFTEVWQDLNPGATTPEVDFSKFLVVFSRNVDFYNRTSIAKITLEEGVAEVLAIATMSAMPIEEKVAMALAVIPREGVEFIQAGNEQIPVRAEQSTADPLNATYTIEGRDIPLLNGRREVEATPGSATKIRTWVFDEPVWGDLNGNGAEDAALLLVHDPGGSGTFYYVAAALNTNGAYRGTNGVLLGDRIAPQNVAIRNGAVIANYADRRFEESMTSPPTVGVSKVMTLEAGELQEIRPLDEGERVVEGWVTIGHEIRSFLPCSGETGFWLLGNSPALNEIMAAHRQAQPDRKRYAPLFMVLAGRYADAPTDGFGAQYEGAFFATELIQVWPRGNCKSELIVVDSPTPGAVVNSPLAVRGKARGTWFFEGDFPLLLKDAGGKVIAEKYATAKGEWMTQDFVPFEGTLEFKKPRSSDRGMLIFKKDNPTGRPEHDHALEIPVFFE